MPQPERKSSHTIENSSNTKTISQWHFIDYLVLVWFPFAINRIFSYSFLMHLNFWTQQVYILWFNLSCPVPDIFLFLL